MLNEFQYSYNAKWTDQFKTDGYVVLRNMIPAQTLAIMTNYYWFLMRKKNMLGRDQTSLGRYGDWLNESLLLRYQKLFEEITTKPLSPTYSFLRLYHNNSVLEKHKDRTASEFAVSIAIDYDTDDIWPLYIKDLHGEEKAIKLDRGDMVLYRGCDLVHWREAYQGNSTLQVFLFYVDTEGPLKHLKYDGRKQLGDPPLDSL